MEIAIRTIGNSKGVVLPKPLLAQAGLEGLSTASIEVVNGAIILRKPVQSQRLGCQLGCGLCPTHAQDTLLLGEFGNVDDAELDW